mgnify:CR=1 FL=1|jgi:hypothetical protein
MGDAVGIGDGVDWSFGDQRWNHRKGERRRMATMGVEKSREGGRRTTTVGRSPRGMEEDGNSQEDSRRKRI